MNDLKTILILSIPLSDRKQITTDIVYINSNEKRMFRDTKNCKKINN
jgi:hypothetical protein